MIATSTPRVCDPPAAVTRSLLGYGVIAGPVYVVTSLAQALTRRGFDLGHDEWSLLANGSLGWIQVTNLILTGAMLIAAAAGIGRALGDRWAPRLLGLYGAAMIAAGVFRADPAYGFPAGTAPGRGTVSWHGTLHLISGAIGFAGLIAACFVLGRVFSRQGATRNAIVSRVVGATFGIGFVTIAVAAGNPVANLAFTAVVVMSFGWLSVVCAHLYSAAGRSLNTRRSST
jgi:Protein of unknown function (DUF998)